MKDYYLYFILCSTLVNLTTAVYGVIAWFWVNTLMVAQLRTGVTLGILSSIQERVDSEFVRVARWKVFHVALHILVFACTLYAAYHKHWDWAITLALQQTAMFAISFLLVQASGLKKLAESLGSK